MSTDYPVLTTAFLRHQHELQQFLFRQVKCPDSAADLLQDTFIHIAQYTAHSPVLNPRAFLYRVAGNLALDYLRAQARRLERDTSRLDEKWSCQQPQPDRFFEARQQWLAVETWLCGLPPASRQIICLCRLEGKNYRQIGAELRLTTRQVEHALHRSQKSLAELRILWG